MNSPYLTTAEAADFVRMSPRSFERLLRDGEFVRDEHYLERPRRGGATRGRVHRVWIPEALTAWLSGREAEHVEGVVPLAQPSRRSA